MIVVLIMCLIKSDYIIIILVVIMSIYVQYEMIKKRFR